MYGMLQLSTADYLVAPESVCISDALLDFLFLMFHLVRTLSYTRSKLCQIFESAPRRVLQGLGILTAQCEQLLGKDLHNQYNNDDRL